MWVDKEAIFVHFPLALPSYRLFGYYRCPSMRFINTTRLKAALSTLICSHDVLHDLLLGKGLCRDVWALGALDEIERGGSALRMLESLERRIVTSTGDVITVPGYGI